MAIRNNHWYNLNEQRSYPIDDTATALSDEGNRIPSSLISDLRLRWPITYGRYGYISAATITKNIVTLLITSSSTLDNSSEDATLIAGVSVPTSELIAGRTYALSPFQQGVGGFITFGSSQLESYRGLFSTPQQTLLTARAARPVRVPPVPSLGVDQVSSSLSGIVNLNVSAPLTVRLEPRVIDNVEYESVVVLGLKEQSDSVDTNDATSVFSRFAGPCGQRVGSRSCSDPQPIETINGVSPNCDGVLTLSFSGCAVVGANQDDCGAVVDCELGLATSCMPPYLPNLTTGVLPSEYPPVASTPAEPEEDDPSVISSVSDLPTSVLNLPYCDTFDDLEAHNFDEVGLSNFGFTSDESPEEYYCCLNAMDAFGCEVSESISVSESEWILQEVASSYGTLTEASEGTTNISLFTGDIQTLFRTYVTDMKIVSGTVASQLSGGIVVNYRLNDSSQPLYHLAKLDLGSSEFGLYRYNGFSLVKVTVASIPAAAADSWHRISISSAPTPGDDTTITVQLSLVSLEDGSVNTSISTTVSYNSWGDDSNKAGLYLDRTMGHFSYWRVESYTP